MGGTELPEALEVVATAVPMHMVAAAGLSPSRTPAPSSPVMQIAAASLPVAPPTTSERSDHYLHPQPGSARYRETQEAQRSILVKAGSGMVSSRI